ncbi:TonB-dependent receptor [Hymenobacter aerilatus]|uniref:TonB-dependent receptor n=1 Tax=Hymenobacter aerilatus TaxID=2932251 RepID=A0A8T9T1V5_9BACT|nr:outer membrane beta-barrel protein [Hymenobacter aerilatus]UOR06953.1 TonB-dependent receptor [Hymenobacter aerilatus]
MKICTLLATFGLLLLSERIHAQQSASVTGSVRDATGRPLALATAVLLHLPDSAVVAAQPTNEQGDYSFTRVAAGRYCLKALLLSYRPARSASFVVGSGPVIVPPLTLTPLSTTLQGVTVQGRLPALEQLADRTVLHVDRLNTAGDNALEVLRKAPGIQLYKDENIVYRGSTGVLILLDGKQTYMSGEALKAYLKSLPASAISQLELLPNPPASLDAAGTAGVLNIRLKRTQRPGLSGTATVAGGYGRYEKASGSTNLHYNVGKVRLFARLSTGRSNSFNRLVQVRHIRDTVYRQVNYWHPLGHSVNYAVGAEVALTPRQTLGGQVRGSRYTETAPTTSETIITGAAGQPVGRLQMDNPQASRSDNAGLNLNYRFALDTLGRELSADVDYVRYTSSADQTFTNLAFTPLSDVARDAGRLRSAESSAVTVRAAKVDYLHPVAGTTWRAETGAKVSWVTTRSALAFDTFAGDIWQPDPLRTNEFEYNETITAAYLSLSTTLGKLRLKGGLRGEHTHSVGASPITGQRVRRDYAQLFPSLFAIYKFSEHDQVGVSGSRRITRPNYQSLNPFLSYTDAYTAHQGNPYLAPSLAMSAVLTYTHRNFQVLGLSYLRATNGINDVVYQNDETKVSTSIEQNLAQATTLILSCGGHSDVTKWWGVDNQLAGSYAQTHTQMEGQPVRLAQFGWSASSDHTFTLPRHFLLTVGGNYRSPTVQGLYYVRANGSLNLGLKKQLWQERATLSLRLTDLFYTDQWRSYLRYNNVNMTWNNQYESRKVLVSFTWKIGNGKVMSRRTAGSQEEENRVSN